MSWQKLQPAPDNTHHLRQNTPAYEQRFSEVLAFHPPGLAAVSLNDKAWHIHPDGKAAYPQHFQRTFGFYEGLAAVIAVDGWYHIDSTGTAISPQNYAWCGNFQGRRCSVRNTAGEYWHIQPNGKEAYAQRWCYAGDFRTDIAVVQADNGYSTHINTQGEYLHQVWFLDLDVFHKGFARARDEAGWMHINQQGKPIYKHRFTAVEPFYNGQARVECFNGALELIDETGKTLVQLRPALRSEFAELSADMVGFWRTQTIASAVELGVLDNLPANTEIIANNCRLTVERSQRLLRALAELALVQQDTDTWYCTERGQYLQTKHPLTLAGAAQEYAGAFTSMWMSLSEALKCDGQWQKPMIFANVANDKQRRERHHQMLSSYAQHDYSEVLTVLSLQGNENVIDAGGGLGVLTNNLLQTYPDMHVTLLERPEVIAQAKLQIPSNPHLSYLEKDLFSDWETDADAVILARVLHDWDDSDALHILQRTHTALCSGGQVFIVEMLLPEDNSAGGLCDLHLLMATGGRERSLSGYKDLLAQANFKLSAVHKLNALPSVIVGEAE
ncbi:methyltransferase [Candidatus Venteria ishoeyi]|uniref:methyltransferase n=1 Tax=Candidatus Venteria ishoeyi TaxID=1899563 RepID=UPI0025A68C1D|nr:methyltransferase [Candidatus Venteria ishoeyi]MDM8546187.1 methyltransferase [Candidatus Venteria ishoeyi]